MHCAHSSTFKDAVVYGAVDNSSYVDVKMHLISSLIVYTLPNTLFIEVVLIKETIMMGMNIYILKAKKESKVSIN